MNRRKYVFFALAAMALSSLLVLLVALSADIYLHSRAERSAGLNRWGYRGPVVGSKRPGEIRVVMLGGSTAFGYGVTWDEAIPAQLERLLNASGLRATVVNLGFNNEGAYSFLPTLQDFAYLDYDIVCLYEGYNDLIGDQLPNRSLFRHESAVFRLTGYFPILPLALGEKALSLRYGGDLNAAYAATRGESAGPTVFHPNLAQRTSAAALETASAVGESLSRQLGRWSEPGAERSAVGGTSPTGCEAPWVHYCESVHAAAQYAIGAGKPVVLSSQPLFLAEMQRHRDQQAAVAGMLARKFPGNPNVRYVDLIDAIDLSDTAFSFDTMHLNPEGNAVIAQHLVDTVRGLAQLREGRQ